MVNLERLLQELDQVLEERVESQQRKVFGIARRLEPRLARDDVLNSDDHPVLRESRAFSYEDGILAGLRSAQILVRSRLRELGAGPAPVPSAPEAHRDGFVHDTGSIPYRHCPRCGGDLELRLLVAHDPERLTCRRCAFVFYLDPKLAAGVIVTLGGGIVLARRGIEPRAGTWGFPSGYVDRGERIEDAAAREVREEVGLLVNVERLVGVYSYPGRPVAVVVFAGRVTGGKLAAGQETREVATFRPAEIPWDELAFSSTRQALQDYLGGAPPGAAGEEKGSGSGRRRPGPPGNPGEGFDPAS